MVRFFSCENEGFIEQNQWQPHVWVNVECPTAAEADMLCLEWGVPESFLENLADDDERPRFEREDGWLLTIVRIPVHAPHDSLSYTTVPLGVITKDDYIITVCYHDNELIDDFIAHTRKRRISINNEPDFILRVIFSSTYWFLRYLKDINDTVGHFTRQLEHDVRNEILLSLMKLQKALVYFNTSVQGNSMLTERVNKLFAADCDVDLLEDVEIELSQAQNTVNVYMAILSNAMDTYASVISNNVNAIMKTMTSVSVILMVPTLIASFYGMNVGVWFGSAPWAFGGIILVSFLLAAVAWYFIKRARWL